MLCTRYLPTENLASGILIPSTWTAINKANTSIAFSCTALKTRPDGALLPFGVVDILLLFRLALGVGGLVKPPEAEMKRTQAYSYCQNSLNTYFTLGISAINVLQLQVPFLLNTGVRPGVDGEIPFPGVFGSDFPTPIQKLNMGITTLF